MQARKGSVKYLEKLENSDKKKTPKAILKDKALVLSLSNNVPKRDLMLNENSESNLDPNNASGSINLNIFPQMPTNDPRF